MSIAAITAPTMGRRRLRSSLFRSVSSIRLRSGWMSTGMLASLHLCLEPLPKRKRQRDYARPDEPCDGLFLDGADEPLAVADVLDHEIVVAAVRDVVPAGEGGFPLRFHLVTPALERVEAFVGDYLVTIGDRHSDSRINVNLSLLREPFRDRLARPWSGIGGLACLHGGRRGLSTAAPLLLSLLHCLLNRSGERRYAPELHQFLKYGEALRGGERFKRRSEPLP